MPGDMTTIRRTSGRAFNQLRPIKVTYDLYGYGAGTVLFELGDTKVLCAASIQTGVPPFLKGSRTGWLTAEYAMLPTATQIRTQRETAERRNGRATEISRIIGRALRAVVKLDTIGERTIMIDCDVLQADGGTRTAAISGAWLALRVAEQRWLAERVISEPILLNDVAAISVGMVRGEPLLDLDCQEDNDADVDFNFVLTSAGHIVEIQGATEKSDAHVSWGDFDRLRSLAMQGIEELFATVKETPLSELPKKQMAHTVDKRAKKDALPLFSLKNRLSNQS
jgi:ribonuclease PH